MTVREILSDPDYPRLKAFVLNHTGLAYYADKDEDFATRIARRFAIVKAPSCKDYFFLLGPTARHPSEMDALVGELTIGETYFFRQNEHFELLRTTIFPDLLQRNIESRKLRIWSAGCATGAEPYSVAVLLYSEFAAEIGDWDVSILGTDINLDFLAQARTASFSDWILRDVPLHVRDRCFRRDGKRWILDAAFHRGVTFGYHNLADSSACASPDNQPFDLILCRNVMIYFSAEQNRAAAAHLFRQMVNGGWLLVGHAESSIELFRQFEAVHTPTVTAYRKPDAGSPVEPPAPAWTPWSDSDFESSLSPVREGAPSVAREMNAMPPSTASLDDLEEARIHADRGEWASAEAICRRLLETDPLNAPAHFILGLILTHTGTAQAAITELRRAVYADHKFALAYYYLGTLLQAAGLLSDARKAFRNSFELLQTFAAEESVELGDSMNVEELRELIRMHQETFGE
jgi:chemotaxis protein methyltransferase CheR